MYLLVSILIVAVFIGLGYATYTSTGKAFPARRSHGGGELVTYNGVGFYVEMLYSLSDDPGVGSTFYIDAGSIIFYVLYFTGLQYLIATLVKEIKKKRESAV